MAPLYESDIAQERWAKAEWNNYEFWERVERRRRRKNALWIAGTALVFLVLSAIPTVIDQGPKWETREAARLLGQELNHLKREAILNRMSYRIRFEETGSLRYVVERAPGCDAPVFQPVRASELATSSHREPLVLLAGSQGEEAGIPGLFRQYCYDPLRGSEGGNFAQNEKGFGIIPARDLEEKRFDRLTVLLISGPGGEASFD